MGSLSRQYRYSTCRHPGGVNSHVAITGLIPCALWIAPLPSSTPLLFRLDFCFSIMGSRVYAGMHSFTDCSVGIVLGIISWLLQHLVMPEVEKWALHSD